MRDEPIASPLPNATGHQVCTARGSPDGKGRIICMTKYIQLVVGGLQSGGRG